MKPGQFGDWWNIATMERIEKVRRIDEIVKQLTAAPTPTEPAKKETLLDVVLKKHGPGSTPKA